MAEASDAGEQPIQEPPIQEPPSARRNETDTPLLVGNNPLIGWVASKLTRRHTPVARGELLCLVNERRAGRDGGCCGLFPRTARLKPRPSTRSSQVNTAGALGTVIEGLTTFLLQNSFQRTDCLAMVSVRARCVRGSQLRKLVPLRLPTVPPRFWSNLFPSPQREGRLRRSGASSPRPSSVARPPTSSARVLQSSMVQVWNWIFAPATVFAGLGVACLAPGASMAVTRWTWGYGRYSPRLSCSQPGQGLGLHGSALTSPLNAAIGVGASIEYAKLCIRLHLGNIRYSGCASVA